MHTRPAPAASDPDARPAPQFPLRRIPIAMLAAAAVLAACGTAGRADPVDAELLTSTVGDPLRQPIEIRTGANGVMDVVLLATMKDLKVPTSSGDTTETLRTYQLLEANGVSYADSQKWGFPGPTFRVRPGDSVSIRLINGLPSDTTTGCMVYPASQPRGDSAAVDTMEDCFHGPNETNIHFHGFHVSPRSPADNVLLTIPPGDTFHYAFRIPHTQSPGTHWYHPHKHGSVALQVTNGMSGAFIVEGGGLDSLTTAYGMREVLVAVQEIDQFPNLIGNVVPRAKLVNGQLSPVIVMRPGEVMRMRLVNENISATANYKVIFGSAPGTGPKLYDVARDGVQYAPANYDTLNADTSLFVAPGNRLDMFVRAPQTAGVHELRTQVLRNRNQSRKQQLGIPLATEQTLLRIEVREAGSASYNTTLPGALPALPDFLANLDSTVNTPSTQLVFTETGAPGGGATPPSFYLGTLEDPLQKFSSEKTFLTMPVDTTQMWQVFNQSPNGINHPFHIHINPFQVIHVEAPAGTADPNYEFYQFLNNASQGGNPVWLDVLALPLPDPSNATGNPGYALIRQRYARFTGAFVMHCHILGHEERGMMQKIAIVGPDGVVHEDHGAHAGH